MRHAIAESVSAPLGHRYWRLARAGWCRGLCKTLIAAALQAANISGALAQEPAVVDSAASHEDYAWVGAGLGAGSEDFAGSVAFSYQHGPHLLSLRVAGTTGLFEDGFADVALLYGRSTSPSGRNRYRAAMGAGIGLAHGCAGGGIFSACVKQPTVVGLPLEAYLAWLPLDAVGVGLYGFADFNRVRSIAGVTLGVQLGDVR